MTQSPVTVTYSLEEVLGQISQKLDRLDNKVEDLGKDMDHKLGDLRKDVDTKFDRLQKEVDTKFDRLQKEVDTSFDQLQKDVDTRFDQVQLKFDHLQGDIIELKVGQTRMEAELKGIGKRLDTQEFINRSVVVGFVLALAAGAVKLFFPGSLN